VVAWLCRRVCVSGRTERERGRERDPHETSHIAGATFANGTGGRGRGADAHPASKAKAVLATLA
jgi:hypothetical protein